MAAPDLLRARQGDTVDSLAWRERGLGAADIGPLLDLNRGVADAGVVLPIGTLVAVPVPATPAPARRDLIQLWD